MVPEELDGGERRRWRAATVESGDSGERHGGGGSDQRQDRTGEGGRRRSDGGDGPFGDGGNDVQTLVAAKSWAEAVWNDTLRHGP